MDPVTIDQLIAFRPQPGDTIVVSLTERPTLEQADWLMGQIQAAIPEGVGALIIHGGTARLDKREQGRRMVPVWMSDEIYLELIGGSVPIRPMKLEPTGTGDGGFDLVVQAVQA